MERMYQFDEVKLRLCITKLWKTCNLISFRKKNLLKCGCFRTLGEKKINANYISDNYIALFIELLHIVLNKRYFIVIATELIFLIFP